MNPSSDKAPTPADIETRQDTVLRQLDELERRIAQVLAEHGVAVELPAPGTICMQAAAAGPRLADALFAEADDPDSAAPDSADVGIGEGGGRQGAAA